MSQLKMKYNVDIYNGFFRLFEKIVVLNISCLFDSVEDAVPL